jgi:hypothetical protein
MTLAEVEALLGGPAAETVDLLALEAPVDQRGYRWFRRWRDGDTWAEAPFRADGSVMAAAGRGRPQPGPLAHLRSLLGW